MSREETRDRQNVAAKQIVGHLFSFEDFTLNYGLKETPKFVCAVCAVELPRNKFGRDGGKRCRKASSATYKSTYNLMIAQHQSAPEEIAGLDVRGFQAGA